MGRGTSRTISAKAPRAGQPMSRGDRAAYQQSRSESYSSQQSRLEAEFRRPNLSSRLSNREINRINTAAAVHQINIATPGYMRIRGRP